MPLLCPTVCIFLLLPLTALRCNSTNSPQSIANDYTIIKTEMYHAEEIIVRAQNNSNCTEHKNIPNCILKNTSSQIATMCNIICKMKRLVNHHLTESVQNSIRKLTDSVEDSVDCKCLKNTTKGPKKPQQDKNPYEQRIQKKLCRVKEFLSALEKCYELLNSELARTEQ